MQCDFDTIGTKSVVADIETALVIHDLFLALGFSKFTIKLNNRQVLSGLLEKLGLSDKSVLLLRSIDKLPKIGREKVAAEMVAVAGATPEQAGEVLKLAELSGDNDAILSRLGPLVAGSELGEQGVARIADILQGFASAGADSAKIKIDVSIARGLDYYTGAIFETFLDDLPTIGSVCSGGRYDNLAGLFTKQDLPGIGASLGLDRLLAAMEELGMLPKTRTPAEVFIPLFDKNLRGNYFALAATLRAAGLGVELFPDAKKLGQQLQYADRRGFRVAIIAGSEEIAKSVVQVKDMAAQTSQTVPVTETASELVTAIKNVLNS
jgi:histidyl-tRNA synthetase